MRDPSVPAREGPKAPTTASPGSRGDNWLARHCCSLALSSPEFLPHTAGAPRVATLPVPSHRQRELALQHPRQGGADPGVWNLREVVSLRWYKAPGAALWPPGEHHPPLGLTEGQGWEHFTASGASPPVLSRALRLRPGQVSRTWGGAAGTNGTQPSQRR